MKDITKTLMICILFLGLLTSGLGAELGATEIKTENDIDHNSDFPIATKTMDTESQSASLRRTVIDWCKIQVISEPVFGQNMNTEYSFFNISIIQITT